MTDKTRLSYSARCVLGWLLVAVLLSEGCSTKKLPEHPTQPLSSYPYSEVKDGLTVAIQPLTNPQESERYFGTDLLSSGIFAVFVSAENRGSPSTFILLKERFNKGWDVQVENAQDQKRLEGRCKAEARRHYSVLHPIKRRKFVQDCVARKGR